MQRKHYKNFYVKPEMDFNNFSDKKNDNNYKYYEWTNKMKAYKQLHSSNKVHYKYLDNLKERCVGGVDMCRFSSLLTGGHSVGSKWASTVAVLVLLKNQLPMQLLLLMVLQILYQF